MQVGSGVRTYHGMYALRGNGRVALLFLGARLADETPSSSEWMTTSLPPHRSIDFIFSSKCWTPVLRYVQDLPLKFSLFHPQKYYKQMDMPSC
jgi:hypothetical protein